MITVEELTPQSWYRLKTLRLASLELDWAAFGGDHAVESLFGEDQWRAKIETLTFLVASIAGDDVGYMSVENLAGDFGATCWVGGCWTRPEQRGKGVLAALFAYLDLHAVEKSWQIQGLGVWTDNYPAIGTYEKLGFIKMGEEISSDRHPGRSYQRMIRQ